MSTHGGYRSGGNQATNARHAGMPPAPANCNSTRARAHTTANANTANDSSSGTGNRDGKLPLPHDFFHAPQLNAKETKYLVNLAKRACKEVVFYSRKTGGPMNWVHLSSEDGVEVFQGMDENATSSSSNNSNTGSSTNRSITYLRGSTRIYASIDDVADFFKLDTPMKLSGFTQTVGKDLLDHKTLYDLALPTAENPKHYVGVKWTAVESPSKLARNRDFCYLECHDEFIDTNSAKRGWVRSLHSIRLPFCPPLDKSHGLVRASLYRSGFVFIESDDKTYVDAVHTLHMDVKGNAPNWIKILAMKRRIKNIAEVNRYFQMRRLCEDRLLGDLELPSKSRIPKCQVCAHKFGFLSRKSTCRKCGNVVCGTCSHDFILDYAGTGAKKVKICTHCSDHVVHGHGGSGGRTVIGTGFGVGGRGERPRAATTVAKPLYDRSPSSHGGGGGGDGGTGARPALLKNRRQLSLEEHEYNTLHEDASGMADIQDAKRMHREFEDHLARSGLRPYAENVPSSLQLPPKPPSSSGGSSSHPRHRGAVATTGNGYDGQRYEEETCRQPQITSKRDEAAPPSSAPLSHTVSTQKTVSAYQEFMAQERERQMNATRSTSRVPLTMGTVAAGDASMQMTKNRSASVNRNSIVRSAAPPVPGDLLSRTRQNRSFTHVLPSASSSTSHMQSPEAVLYSPPALASIHASSEWEEDYVDPLSRLRRLRDNASILSDDTVGAPIRRSDLSNDRSSRVSSSDLIRPSSANHDTTTDDMLHRHHAATMPPSFPSYPSPPSTDSFSQDRPPAAHGGRQSYSTGPTSQPSAHSSDFDFQQLQQRYFNARNSDINELEHRMHDQPATEDEGDFRFGYDASSAATSDVAESLEEYEVLAPGRSVSHVSKTAKSSQRDPATELATAMALSAMRLYEKENGVDMEVSEETRQAALQKMVEIYTDEIERNNNAGDQQQRANPAPTRRTGRSASVAGRAGPRSVSSQGSRSERERAHAQTMMATPQHHRPSSDSFMEYRNLSDLSASAFKAFQKGTLNDGTSSLPRSDAEPSLPSTTAGTSRRHKSGPDSKTSSRRNAPLGLAGTTDDHHSRGAGTTNGSLPGSDSHRISKPPSRPNSVRDDVSDTFSELDLIDLPHLMRADEAATNYDRGMDRLSQESQQTTFSELSSLGRVSSLSLPVDAGAVEPATPALATVEDPEPLDRLSDSVYASLHAHPGIHSPLSRPGGSVSGENDDVLSEDDDVNNDDDDDNDGDGDDDRDDDGKIGDGDYDDDYDDGDLTSRSMMTRSELERYRASLAELMAEYNNEHNQSGSPMVKGATGRQPEREREPDTRTQQTLAMSSAAASYKSPRAHSAGQPNLERVLQELYL